MTNIHFAKRDENESSMTQERPPPPGLPLTVSPLKRDGISCHSRYLIFKKGNARFTIFLWYVCFAMMWNISSFT